MRRDARYLNNKSLLMNKLKHEQSSRGSSFDAILIDGGGLLYKIYWPANGTVSDLIDGLEKYTRKLNADSDVFIVFDRYMERSIKSDTRQARIGSFRRCHQLALDRQLPPREICLSSLYKRYFSGFLSITLDIIVVYCILKWKIHLYWTIKRFYSFQLKSYKIYK